MRTTSKIAAGIAGALLFSASLASASPTFLVAGQAGIPATNHASAFYEFYGAWNHQGAGSDTLYFPLNLSSSTYPEAGHWTGLSSTVYTAVQGSVPSLNSEVCVNTISITYDASSFWSSGTICAGQGLGNTGFSAIGTWFSGGLYVPPSGSAVVYATVTGNNTRVMNVMYTSL